MILDKLPARLPLGTFFAVCWRCTPGEDGVALWSVEPPWSPGRVRQLKTVVDRKGCTENTKFVSEKVTWVEGCKFLVFRPETDDHAIVSALLTLAGGPRVLEFLRQAFIEARKTDDAHVLRTDRKPLCS